MTIAVTGCRHNFFDRLKDATANYMLAIEQDCLQHYYPVWSDQGEGSSTVVEDQKGLGGFYDGTLKKNATFVYNSNFQKPVLQLDGTGDRVNVGDMHFFQDLGSFTVLARVNPSSVTLDSGSHGSTGTPIIDKSGTDTDVFAMYLASASEVYAHINTGNGDFEVETTTSPISTDTWQMIAVRYTGDALQIFVDNVLEAEDTTASGNMTDSSNPITFGIDDQENATFFNGDMQHLLFYCDSHPIDRLILPFKPTGTPGGGGNGGGGNVKGA